MCACIIILFGIHEGQLRPSHTEVVKEGGREERGLRRCFPSRKKVHC